MNSKMTPTAAGVGSDRRDWEAARSRFLSAASTSGEATVRFSYHETPLGSLLLLATDAGVVRVALPSEDHDAVLQEVSAAVSPRVLPAEDSTLSSVRGQLDLYFDGQLRHFTVPLDWRLSRTAFRREALHALLQVPYGETVSYGELAAQAGHPAAVRATGSAMATNPLPLLVPCHRVLRSGGQLGNYRGGVDAKRQLLKLEGSLAAAAA